MTKTSKQRLQEIQTELKSLKKSDPKSHDLYMEASSLFTLLGNIKSAKQCLDQAMKLKPIKSMLCELPLELMQKILGYLTMLEKIRLRQVNRELNRKLSSHIFWFEFDLSSPYTLSNKSFAQLWKLNKGKCKSLKLLKPKMTSSFVKLIDDMPSSLITLDIQQAPKITGMSVLKFLTNKTVYSTLTTVRLIGIQDCSNLVVSRLLKYLKALKTLDISHSDIDDGAFDTTELKLESLRLDYTKVTFQALDLLSKRATELKELYCNHCKSLNGSSIMKICEFKKLEKLSLDSITDSIPSLDQWILAMSKLHVKALSWRNCPRLHDAGLAALFRNSKELETVCLDGCAGLRNSVVLLFQLPRIKQVSLKNCQMYDPTLVEIPLTIEYLDVSGHPRINDVFLEKCAGIPMLTYLLVARCSSITNSGVLKLVKKKGKKFVKLELSENVQIGSDAVQELRKKFGSGVKFYTT
jgi:F-box and leucine-rich repeat protein GRR1